MAESIFDKDKWYHFVVCIIISFFTTEGAVCAAAAKEFGDMRAYGNHWCWLDIVADAAGIVIGTLLRLLIIHHWYWF